MLDDHGVDWLTQLDTEEIEVDEVSDEELRKTIQEIIPLLEDLEESLPKKKETGLSFMGAK